jgi:curved DNA-binding protein
MTASVKDYYLLLGLSASASEDHVRRAYRKLARKYHPDFNPGNKFAEDKFKEISEAYEVLSDRSSRKRYDEMIEAAKYSGPERGPQINVRFSSPATHRDKGVLGGLFDYILRGNRGSSRGAKGHSSSRTAPGKTRGAQRRLEAEISITLEEAHRGALHRLALNEQTRCPSCKGRQKAMGRPCGLCGSTGLFQKSSMLDVNIPPGARNGSVIKVPTRTGPGQRGQELYIRLAVKPHDLFSIDGDDLQMDLQITPWEAVFGAAVEVPTLDGKKAEIRIPAPAQGGQRIRLRAYGLNTRGGGRGDLYVRLNIVVPPEPDDKELELYRELARISSFQPR